MNHPAMSGDFTKSMFFFRVNNQFKPNRMKKIFLCIMAVYLLLTFYPCQLTAGDTIVSSSSSLVTPGSEKLTEAKARVLLVKLNEIKTMDKSNLTSQERKKLRREVHFIKNEFRETYRGRYQTVGSVIIIPIMLFLFY